MDHGTPPQHRRHILASENDDVADHLSFASGAYAWSVDIDSGELIESFDCFEWDENGEAVPLDNMFGGCAMAVMTDDAIYLANAFDELIRYRTFDAEPGRIDAGTLAHTRFSTGDGVVLSHLLSNDEWMPDHCGPIGQESCSRTTSPSLGLGRAAWKTPPTLPACQPSNGSFTIG